MTDQSTGRILRAMTPDPEAIFQRIEEWMRDREEKKARMLAFKGSGTFHRMVAAITEANGKIDSESFSYFPEREAGGAGWSEFSKEDITAMLDLCSDPRAAWVDPGSVKRDVECPFEAYEYTISGLRIGLITGQGTSIVIRPA